MATFTRNAWETGDTITAEGLNGGNGYMLVEVNPETDFDGTAGSWVFDIDTGITDLSVQEMFRIVLNVPTAGTTTEYIHPYAVFDSGDYYHMLFYNLNPSVSLYYIPATGHLTTTEPSS